MSVSGSVPPARTKATQVTWTQFLPCLIPFPDTIIDQTEKLEFHAQDHIERLWNIVREATTPHHILVADPWGHGKSTIVQGVRRKAEAERLFETVEINAWKYSGDSLQRKLMLEVANQISPRTQQAIKTRMYKTLPSVRAHSVTNLREQSPRVWRLLLTVLLVLGVVGSVAAFQVWLGTGTDANITWVDAWKKQISALLTANLLTLLVSLALVELTAIYARKDGYLELTHSEQYEGLFVEALDSYQRQRLGWSRNRKRFEWRRSTEMRKLVVVIDDLDRCSDQQITETVQTIKTFMNSNGCIFLVACDRQRLERALRNLLDSDTDGYIDKIFETIYFIGTPSRNDLIDYAKRLLEERLPSSLPEATRTRFADTLKAFADGLVKSGAIDLLIQDTIKTPRRVKRILNQFFIVCGSYFRKDKPVLQSGMEREWRAAARLAMISVRFPEYADAFRDYPQLLDWLPAIADGSTAEPFLHAKRICSRFFVRDDQQRVNWKKPRQEAEELLAFVFDQWDDSAPRSDQKASLMDAARAGEWDQIEHAITEDPQLTNHLRGWITTGLRVPRTDRELVQGNLLHVLLHLEPPASDSDPTMLVFKSHSSILLETPSLWRAGELTRLLIWIHRLDPDTRREWQELVAERLQNEPDQLAPALLNMAALEQLAGFYDEPRHSVARTLMDWVTTPTGQTYWTQFAASPDTEVVQQTVLAADVTTLLSRLVKSIVLDGPLAALLKTFLHLFGNSLAEQNHEQFWQLVLDLAARGIEQPENGVNDWLLPLVESWANRMPIGYMESLVDLLLKNDTWSVEHGLGVIDRLARLRPDWTQRDKSGSLMRHLVGLNPGHLSPRVAEAVLGEWASWSEKAKAMFVNALLGHVAACDELAAFRQATAWFGRLTKPELTQPTLESYFGTLFSRWRDHWTDPQWRECLCDLITPSTTNPLRLPPTLEDGLLKLLERCAFDRKAPQGQTEALPQLAKVIRGIAPVVDRASWIRRILREYVQPGHERQIQVATEALCTLTAGDSQLIASASLAVRELIALLPQLPGQNWQLKAALRRIIGGLGVKLELERETQRIVESFLLSELEQVSLTDMLHTLSDMTGKLDLTTVLLQMACNLTGQGTAFNQLALWVGRNCETGRLSINAMIERFLAATHGQQLLVHIARGPHRIGTEVAAAIISDLALHPSRVEAGFHVLNALSDHLTKADRKKIGQAVCTLSLHNPEELRKVLDLLPEALAGKNNTPQVQHLRDALQIAGEKPDSQFAGAVDALIKKSFPTSRTTHGSRRRTRVPDLRDNGQAYPRAMSAPHSEMEAAMQQVASTSMPERKGIPGQSARHGRRRNRRRTKAKRHVPPS